MTRISANLSLCLDTSGHEGNPFSKSGVSTLTQDPAREDMIMVRAFVVAGVLLLAAGCGSGSPGASATSPTPAAVVFDQHGHEACQAALKDGWLAARMSAKLSAITGLQDVALREEQTGSRDLIKAWCRQHYSG